MWKPNSGADQEVIVMSSHWLRSCMLLTLSILQFQVCFSHEWTSIPPLETMVWPCSVVQMKEMMLFLAASQGKYLWSVGEESTPGQVQGKDNMSTVWSSLQCVLHSKNFSQMNRTTICLFVHVAQCNSEVAYVNYQGSIQLASLILLWAIVYVTSLDYLKWLYFL